MFSAHLLLTSKAEVINSPAPIASIVNPQADFKSVSSFKPSCSLSLPSRLLVKYLQLDLFKVFLLEQ